jgi:hypothetical protein
MNGDSVTVCAPDVQLNKRLKRGGFMSDQDHGDSGPVPMMQKLLDNPFLLLFLGVAIPALLYLVWGIMEIVTIPLR